MLKIFKENRNDFEVEYENDEDAYRNSFLSDNGNFNFPPKINLKKVEQKINLSKSLISNETYKLYFDEIINILNYKYTINLDNEKKKYYTQVRTDEQKKENINNIMKAKAIKKNEDQSITDEVAKTGKFQYEPVYGAAPGRYRK